MTDLSSAFAYEQDSPTIEVHALDPSKPRRVTITHDGRKLVGSVYLKGDEAGPLTVRLQPSGTLTGRIVDEEGQPRGGLELNNLDGFCPEPPPTGASCRRVTSTWESVVGRDGRFRVKGLDPGPQVRGEGVAGNGAPGRSLPRRDRRARRGQGPG